MLVIIFALLALWFILWCLDSITKDLNKFNAWMVKKTPTPKKRPVRTRVRKEPV